MELNGAIEDTLIRLDELGLSEIAEDGPLRLHRLVAAFVQEVSADDVVQAVVEQALADEGHRLVNAGYPARLQPILAHLRHAVVLADRRGDVQAGKLTNALGRAEEALVNYMAARLLYERALSIREQALGPQHPDTAQSLNNLAGLLQQQGDVETARQYHERALAIREATLGPNHPDTAQSLWWISTLLQQAGDHDDARERLRRAAAIYTHTLGEQHPTTQQCHRQLAALNAPPPSAAQQIADITAQAEAAVAAALADPSIDRDALAERLEIVAQQAEDGQQEGSPYLALATHLRALAARLDVPNESQELAALLQCAQAATDRALAEGDATACADLAERLSTTADAYAGGERPGSPRHNLAGQLRALAVQLNASPGGESA